jgi:hypothetical protein
MAIKPRTGAKIKKKYKEIKNGVISIQSNLYLNFRCILQRFWKCSAKACKETAFSSDVKFSECLGLLETSFFEDSFQRMEKKNVCRCEIRRIVYLWGGGGLFLQHAVRPEMPSLSLPCPLLEIVTSPRKCASTISRWPQGREIYWLSAFQAHILHESHNVCKKYDRHNFDFEPYKRQF